MSPPTYEPAFFLLKHRLPPSESANLLGRVIRRYQDPTLDYTPESPSSTLTPPTPEFTDFLLPAQHDLSAHFTAQSADNTSRWLKFISLLSTTTTTAGSTTITSPRIITRRLKREQAYFETLKSIPHVRRKILEMCPVGDKVYLVVGTMSVQSAQFDHSTIQTHERSTGVALPLALAASAAAMSFGAPLGPCAEVIPDAEAGVSRASSSVSTASFSTAAGDGEEEVFAVACKVITRTWHGLGKDVGVRERQPEYRGGRHFGHYDCLRMEQDNGSDSDESNDGSDVNEETEVDIARGLKLADEGLGGLGSIGDVLGSVFNPYLGNTQMEDDLQKSVEKGGYVR